MNVCYVGNDIVDYGTPETCNKFFDQRFLKRVYSAMEQRVIREATNPNAMLWALWAIKEAFYKAYSKQANCYFSPKQYSVTKPILNDLCRSNWDRDINKKFLMLTPLPDGKKDLNVELTLQVSNNVIHAIIHSPLAHLSRLAIQLRSLEAQTTYKEQSQAARQLLCKWARAAGFGDDVQVIRLPIKNAKRLGPPQLYSTKRDLSTIPISLSHDGRWLGFAAVH